MNHAEFDVRGLSCELSVASVVGALAFVPGVSAITLLLPERSVRVSFDPRKACLAQLLRAAEATGHSVRERTPEVHSRLSSASTGARCARTVHRGTDSDRLPVPSVAASFITKR